VFKVSSKEDTAAEMLAIMTVRQLPPSESFSNLPNSPKCLEKNVLPATARRFTKVGRGNLVRFELRHEEGSGPGPHELPGQLGVAVGHEGAPVSLFSERVDAVPEGEKGPVNVRALLPHREPSLFKKRQPAHSKPQRLQAKAVVFMHEEEQFLKVTTKQRRGRAGVSGR
jgi:hypothetical protein